MLTKPGIVLDTCLQTAVPTAHTNPNTQLSPFKTKLRKRAKLLSNDCLAKLSECLFEAILVLLFFLSSLFPTPATQQQQSQYKQNPHHGSNNDIRHRVEKSTVSRFVK